MIPASTTEFMTIVPGRAPALDFSRPLEALKACHERTRAQCEAMCQLARHLSSRGCDAWAQETASNLLRYFDGAGRHHEEDEELDLFPRMIAAAVGQAAERVALLTARLEREHRAMVEAWSSLRDDLERIAHGEKAPLDRRAVDRFRELYRAHIALEDADVIPLAEALLDDDALAAIGRAMAARRGIR